MDLRERSAKFLTDKMCARLESLADPNSPEFLPHRRDFAFSSLQTLMLGRALSKLQQQFKFASRFIETMSILRRWQRRTSKQSLSSRGCSAGGCSCDPP